jgi:glycosyltransferase involved in cell wall biosynthesis
MTILRILVLGPYPALNPRHGGQIRLAQILAAYRARGFQVKQASFFPAHPFYTDSPLGEADVALPLAQLQSWRDRPAPFIEDLACGEVASNDAAQLAALERFSGRVDVVEIEHPWLLPVAHKLRERGAIGAFKLVYGSHNIEYQLKRAIFSQYGVQHAEELIAAIEALERQSAAEAVLVGAVTPEDARVLQGWTRAPVVLAPNGVSPWRSTPQARERWRAQLGEEPFALYVASAHPPNISGFCESFGTCLASLSPVQKLVLAGAVGEHIVASEWFKRWAPLNQRRVICAGILADDDLSALRDLAHTFVLPMTSGGGSNLKTAEALYSGKRVIATPLALRGFEEFSNLPGVDTALPGTEFGKAVSASLLQPVLTRTAQQLEQLESLTWARTLAALCDEMEALAPA